MSEVEPYTEEELRDKVAYGCPDCARLLATIEAYKAEVEGARNAALEEALRACSGVAIVANAATNNIWQKGFRHGADMCATGVAALKTTPAGGE